MKKKILLIAPDFFNYHQHITTELKNQNWEVIYLNDRPTANPFMKILIRKFRFLVEWYLNSYYLNQLRSLGKFDHVLIIKGEGITPQVTSYIKKNHLNGCIFLYLWDGIKNSTGALLNAKIVDKVYTFDYEDSKKFGFNLLPLFYIAPLNSQIQNEPLNNYKWNLSFLGSSHGDRLKVISLVKKSFAGEFFIFVYFPSRLLYYFRMLTDINFYSFSKNQLSLISIEKSKAISIFNDSEAVLDIQNNNQTGLTMRTLEVLSLGKKIVTTNSSIKEYDFYHPNNVFIIDRKNPILDLSFFKLPFDKNSQTHLKKYEISCWVKELTTSVN